MLKWDKIYKADMHPYHCINKGRLKKDRTNLRFWPKLGGGVREGLKGPTCSTGYSLSLEHAKKHSQTI